MSLSTWLFGKKKSPTVPAPTETVGEETDDYVIIEKKRQTPQYPMIGDHNMYPQLPYSLGPGPAPMYPPAQVNHNLRHQESLDSGSNMLAGVPFKLSTELVKDDAREFSEISARVNDVLFKVSQLGRNEEEYNFSVENNVVAQSGF